MNIQNRAQFKVVQKQIYEKVKEEKRKHKDKVNILFRGNKAKDAWKELKTVFTSPFLASDPSTSKSQCTVLQMLSIIGFKQYC